MKTNDEPASRKDRPPQVQHSSATQARNVGFRSTTPQLCSKGRRRVACGFKAGPVSSKRSATKPSVTAPNSAVAINVTGQPRHCASSAPMTGLSIAITPRPLRARDSTRAPSCGRYRSRTTLRPQVTAAAMAAPCTARHATSASMLLASALNRLATVYSARPPATPGAGRSGRPASPTRVG